MDINDIKRLPTQFDSSYQSNRAVKNSADVKVDKSPKAEQTEAAGRVVDQDTTQKVQNEHKEPPKVADIEAAVDKLREHVQSLDRELQFQVDSNTGNTVVKILDSKTQEVVRQIPSEELVELSEHLENVQGTIFNSEA